MNSKRRAVGAARPGVSAAAVGSPPRDDSLAAELMEIIARTARERSRAALRVAGQEAAGRVFADGGYIVHADFGEDYGLRALLEMRSLPRVVIEPCADPFPGHASLQLGAEMLASVMGSGSDASQQMVTRVVRKVDLPVEPPPLPEPEHWAEASTPRAAARPWLPPSSPVLADAAEVAALPFPEPVGLAAASRSARLRRSETPDGDPGRARPNEVVAELMAAPRESAVVPRGSAGQSVVATTMVRVSPDGALLAAHGPRPDRLADSAMFIHGLASAIAMDFACEADAGVHLRSAADSLFVVRSEAGDIGAALGATQRLGSLLRTVGLR